MLEPYTVSVIFKNVCILKGQVWALVIQSQWNIATLFGHTLVRFPTDRSQTLGTSLILRYSLSISCVDQEVFADWFTSKVEDLVRVSFFFQCWLKVCNHSLFFSKLYYGLSQENSSPQQFTFLQSFLRMKWMSLSFIPFNIMCFSLRIQRCLRRVSRRTRS